MKTIREQIQDDFKNSNSRLSQEDLDTMLDVVINFFETVNQRKIKFGNLFGIMPLVLSNILTNFVSNIEDGELVEWCKESSFPIPGLNGKPELIKRFICHTILQNAMLDCNDYLTGKAVVLGGNK